MTQVVTVHTDFTDLNQMAQGLVGRVNETHVILPGPDPVGVGDWVQFAVTLYDGTPGFAGVGRCVTVVDNGDERLSHQRYDVVIDSLQFDPRGQQIFEHILMLHGAPAPAEESYADEQGYDAGGYAEGGYAEAEERVAHDDYAEPQAEYAAPVEDTGAFEDVSADFTGSHAVAAVPETEFEAEDREATMMADRDELEAALAQSVAEEAQDEAMPTAPPPPHVTTPVPAVWGAPSEPPPAVNGTHSAPSVSPKAVNGVSFKYTDGLPLPAVPPRPRLDPARRVSPAPRPTRH
jgi:hypothetical protein